MSLLSEPSILDDLARLLVIGGIVGQCSLFFFPARRRLLERSLAVLFTIAVGGGVGLAWRADQLREADRTLNAAQQATLSRAVGQFPGLKYQVFARTDDREAEALARRIADAIKAGNGTAPSFDPIVTPHSGVILLVRAREAVASRALDPIGRALMAARAATIYDLSPELEDNTVRIVVGRKP